MKKAVLFDLDGTLINSLEDLCDAVNYMLERLGLPLRSIEEVKGFVGNGANILIRRSIGENPFDMDIAREYFKEYYNINLMNKTKAYEGIETLIQELRKKGFKLGIVTNKPQWAADKIADWLFKDCFDVVVGSESGRNKKPDKEPVKLALEIMGVKRDDAVYVGDSEVDIETAHNMNMTFVGVAWGFRNESIFDKEKYFVRTSGELLTLCCNLK